MLETGTHTQFAEATAALMRSCAVAAAQTMTASACHGLTLWSDMLRAPAARPPRPTMRASFAGPFEAFWTGSRSSWPFGGWLATPSAAPGWNPYMALWTTSPSVSWPMFADWTNWSRSYWPASNVQPAAAINLFAPMTMPSAAPAFASYRTPGGHAVAQVIAPVADTVIAGMTAAAVFTHMQSMLGAWRAALRV